MRESVRSHRTRLCQRPLISTRIPHPALILSSSTPQLDAADVSSEWRDENGCVCAKNVNYARRCPKARDLIPVDGSNVILRRNAAAAFLCRICHETCAQTRASHLLECSVAGCCGGYSICRTCVGVVIRESSVSCLLNNFAVAMFKSGQCDDALEAHESALELSRSFLSPDHPDIACSMDGIARSHLKIGRHNEVQRGMDARATHSNATLLCPVV